MEHIKTLIKKNNNNNGTVSLSHFICIFIHFIFIFIEYKAPSKNRMISEMHVN